MTNWLVVDPALWKILVSWGYYSQYVESHKLHVPNHQPDPGFFWNVKVLLVKSPWILHQKGACSQQPRQHSRRPGGPHDAKEEPKAHASLEMEPGAIYIEIIWILYIYICIYIIDYIYIYGSYLI